ncbi:hypothetical protein PUN28_017997 [Cardiocondyla obscurior]|uniref:Uncharacterized protein n=1 Tax=Cardiocondyla obscurior TaxID=286306 RepID=A0AAW2EFE9_9HYME
MVTTIQQALRPFLVMCFIVGLGFYPQKEFKNWWTAYLSILYSLMIWFTYAYLFYYIILLFTIKILFRTSVAIVVTEINIFTLIVSVIMSFYHQKVKFVFQYLTISAIGSRNLFFSIMSWSSERVLPPILLPLRVPIYFDELITNLIRKLNIKTIIAIFTYFKYSMYNLDRILPRYYEFFSVPQKQQVEAQAVFVPVELKLVLADAGDLFFPLISSGDSFLYFLYAYVIFYVSYQFRSFLESDIANILHFLYYNIILFYLRSFCVSKKKKKVMYFQLLKIHGLKDATYQQ